MRKLVVDGKDFEWVAGKSFVRIRGNGHVADIKLTEFREKESATLIEREDGGSFTVVLPSDVVNYIQKHGWSS